MKNLTLLLILLILLAGCATPNTMMVHSTTGEYRNCAASGWGYIGAPIAMMTHDSCVDSLRSIGFIKVDEVTPGILTITATPPGCDILVGPNKESLKFYGVTPISLKHNPGSSLWIPECYQARKTGYQDSQIQCFGQQWGDRRISFVLNK